MLNFGRRQKKARQWINGPLSDWVIPYRCNVWFQCAHALQIVVAVYAIICVQTRSFDALVVAVLAFAASMVMLGVTQFGRETVRSYRHTRAMIASRGKIAPQVQIQYGKKMYCVRAGVRTAASDSGLLRDLIPALANRWKPY